jgi:hypothetical protein
MNKLDQTPASIQTSRRMGQSGGPFVVFSTGGGTRRFPPFSGLLGLLFTVGLCAGGGCQDDEFANIITPVAEQHYQGGGALDLLFVIDTSGSMGEEQEALGRGFASFIESFIVLESDFHLGITDMDLGNSGGALIGDPRFLTGETENLVEVFNENAQLGVMGSGMEQGLENARLAFRDSRLEGVNEGFYRSDAVLVLIFVSDEDDQSNREVSEYLEFFDELKYGDKRRIQMNAIAGDVPDGCETAVSGSRYAEVVEATGGIFESICQEDLGMPSMGEVLSGYKSAFQLVHEPYDPDEIVVMVDEEEVLGGPDTWELDEQNRIAFAVDAIPIDCSEVVITYSTLEPVENADEPKVFEAENSICPTRDVNLEELTPAKQGCSTTGHETFFSLGTACLFLGWARRKRHLPL